MNDKKAKCEFRLESFVTVALSSATKGLVPPLRRKTTRRIIESIITIVLLFVCRKTLLGTGEDIPRSRYLRLIKDFRKMSIRIISRETPNNDEYGYVKYWLDSLMVTLMKDDQYPVMKPEWSERLFSGLLWRIISRAVNRRNAAFVYSLQKGTKACWLPPGLLKMSETCDAHKKKLTRVYTEIEPQLYDAIYRVSELDNRDMGSRNKFCPSGSACYQTVRSKGGCAGNYDSLSLNPEPLTGVPLWDISSHVNQYRSRIHSQAAATVNRMMLLDPDLPLRARLCFVNDAGGKLRGITAHEGNINTALQPIQGQLLRNWKTQDCATMRGNDCTQKVRELDENLPELPYLISADFEAATDFLMKAATQAVFDPLRDKGVPDAHLAAYSQSGCIIEYPEIWDVTPPRVKIVGGEPFIVFQKFDIDQGWVKHVCNSSRWRKISGLNSISPSQLKNKDIARSYFGTCIRESEEVYCEEGQTMGGPVSFTTLCTINKAAYLKSIEEWYLDPIRRYFPRSEKFFGNSEKVQSRLRDLALIDESGVVLSSIVEYTRRGPIYTKLRKYFLINGDDLLMKADESLYAIWKKWVTLAGLRPSQGKNFKSVDMCTINSQLFVRKGESRELTRVGYANLGMLYGMDEGQLTNPLQFAQGLNDMFTTCPTAKPLLPMVMKRFDGHYGSFRPNWFIHHALGGFGIDPDHCLGDLKITSKQRGMAWRFKREPHLALHRKMRSENDTMSWKQDVKSIFDRLIKVEMRFGPYVRGPLEVPYRDSEWLIRFAQMNYMADSMKYTTDIPDYRNVKMARRKAKLLSVQKCLVRDIDFTVLSIPCPSLMPVTNAFSWEVCGFGRQGDYPPVNEDADFWIKVDNLYTEVEEAAYGTGGKKSGHQVGQSEHLLDDRRRGSEF